MSLSSARSGMRPSATARPPQNGSTSRRCVCARHNPSRRGTCHPLPPPHLKGGANNNAPGVYPLVQRQLSAIFFTEFTLTYGKPTSPLTSRVCLSVGPSTLAPPITPLVPTSLSISIVPSSPWLPSPLIST